jgi:hypothetical protein
LEVQQNETSLAYKEYVQFGAYTPQVLQATPTVPRNNPGTRKKGKQLILSITRIQRCYDEAQALLEAKTAPLDAIETSLVNEVDGQ